MENPYFSIKFEILLVETTMLVGSEFAFRDRNILFRDFLFFQVPNKNSAVFLMFLPLYLRWHFSF